MSEVDHSATGGVPGGRIHRRVLTVLLVIALACVGLLATVRYVVLLPQAQHLIETTTDGLKVGRFGRLKIEGLKGDLWRDFEIERVTLRDAKGPWLEVRRLHIKWRYVRLLTRRLQVDDVRFRRLELLRRPILEPGGPAGESPVSVRLDHIHGRVEFEPAFSFERGVYDLDASLGLGRRGGMRGRIRAISALRPGDHLYARFDLAEDRPLVVLVDALEARGGALAGALGLPAGEPFLLRVTASGRIAEGRFAAEALSGAARPLQARGAWSRLGGKASGRLSLTASSLTATLAKRIGPEVRFELSGRKAEPDLFALRAQVTAENLAASAFGMGDLGKRKLGPRGINLVVTTPALSRISGGPAIGAARLAGTVTQTSDGWRFSGRTSAERAVIGSYLLRRTGGPLELVSGKQQLTVKLQLAGEGGQGSGFIGAIMGSAPKAEFEGARLKDGRLMLRRLEVSGAGLRLSASGGQGLWGGLSFKGEAVLSRLAAARPGAEGSVRADWSASQTRVGQPWSLAFEAHGDKLATGYTELDRLLGARPELKLQAYFKGRRVVVRQANLSGSALQTSSAGTFTTDGKLALKIDWTAKGPFEAGPVEITGAVKGSGSVTGALGAPRADLIAHLDAIDAPRLPLRDADLTVTFERRPDGAAGAIAATATSAFGPARARSAFRFPDGGVDLTELSVDAGGLKASGSLSLRRNAPPAADLQLVAERGAFLDAGRVRGRVRLTGAGRAQAIVNLTVEDARLPGSQIVVRGGRLTADGPVARLPYELTADGASPQGRWRVSGRGAFAEVTPGYSVSFDGAGELAGRELRTAETAVLTFGGPERSARLRLVASDGGRINLDSRMTAEAAEVHAQIAGLGLRMLNEDVAGRFDVSLSLQGRGERLDGALDLRLSGARGRGAPVASGVDGTVRGRLAGSTLTLVADASNAQGLKAGGELTLPTATSASPFRIAIARLEPMRGRFFADGEVRPLFDLLVGGERSFAGRVRAQGTVSGSLAEPRANGEVVVADGRFDEGATGLSLRQISLRANFAESAIDVTEASGVDGHGGSLTGQGRISLQRAGVSNFRLNLKGFRLIENELATATATGQATIDRTADGKVRLAGALTIDQADVAARLPTPSGVVAMQVVEKNRPITLVSDVPTPSYGGGEGWALDVALKAPGRVFLRGRGLDLEFSLDAHVGGTTTHPQLSGTARVVRGDYDFAGKRFEFDPASVVHLATDASDIRLDLLATREDPSLTAVVRIRGSADRPEVTLTSTPVLPSDEVLSQVLFGRTASQLSTLEAAQLASALSSLAGGDFDVLGSLRTFAGLDRLAFGGGTTAAGVTVSGGKYLSRNVYLEVTGGGREGPAAQVEWRFRPGLAFISKVATQTGNSLAIRWRRNY